MREIGCCQLGVYILLWEFREFPWQEDHLKQTDKLEVKINGIVTKV